MIYVEDTLSVDGEGSEFSLIGNCDVWISGLTSGSVTLKIKFPRSTTWRDVPDATFTQDTWKTIFISESGVQGKLVGSNNNDGVYVRLARYSNK
jgi:hypothetical protein